jgi:hypothetical protein
MTKLHGMITPEAANKLKDELRGIFTVVKSLKDCASIILNPF